MSFTRIAAAAVIVAGMGLAGCSSASKALGIGATTPDEFRTVARAPLVVPPDYSLRPPAPDRRGKRRQRPPG